MVNEAGESLGEMRRDWLGPVTFSKYDFSHLIRQRSKRPPLSLIPAQAGTQPGSPTSEHQALVPLEILHRVFVSLGGGARSERPEIAASSGLWVLLARIEPVFAGGKLANHDAGLS